MLFFKPSTIATIASMAFFALLFSLIVFLVVSPKPKKLEATCDNGTLKYALQNCVTDLLTDGRFYNFNVLQVKVVPQSSHYIVTESNNWSFPHLFRPFAAASPSTASTKFPFFLSTVNTTNIQYDINGYKKDHCGVHGAQLYDCAYINEVFQMALFVLAIAVVAFFFIYNIYRTVLLSGVVRRWFVEYLP
ncbi:hypothetical protein TYRP_015882, partial [Tyrophagus putrescentiae]